MREKVVCLVSGGIDSPVACALTARRFEVLPLHLCLFPFTCEESFLIAMDALRAIKERNGFEKAIVYPWARILRRILGNRKYGHYACLACRRGMFLVAERVCEREGAVGIVTGESLGQKATQTLSNLGSSSHGVRFPILRPLLGLDKLEIERLSKELGIWHQKHAGCCYAVPKHPRTRSDPEVLEEFMDELDLGDLIEDGFRDILEVRTFEEDFRGYLEGLA